MDLDFQSQQRFYAVSYGTTKALLDGMGRLSFAEETLLEADERPPAGISLPPEFSVELEKEPKDTSPPRLPEEQFVPLPEGMHLLEDGGA